jgi:hypothetical protein
MRRFFVIGAQRSGSTWLYRMLDEHPDIAMNKPVRPEPKFFLVGEEFDRGLDWYDGRYFAHATPGQLRGEKSVGYLESDAAARRMEQTVPDSRVVAILRDPVDRALSHYRFSVVNGLETLDVDAALASEGDRAARDGDFFVVGDRRLASDPFAYRRRGEYVLDLEKWRPFEARGLLKVLVFEHAVSDRRVVRDLFDFLGVDDSFEPPGFEQVVNASAETESSPGRATIDRLREHFRGPNALLAERFGLDLDLWGA